MRWLVLFCAMALHGAQAQSLALPEPVTNNAVVALQKEGRTLFYSFYGLDSTKRWSGVHNKVFRVDKATGRSATIGNVPDVGRLAATATALGNKAYLVGGYAVFGDGKEKSSDQLFIFDPQTELFTRRAPLPLPIDDHVQGVWRNKLLYVISGWSDSLNVNAVQVYDPEADSWQLGTPLPDEAGAKVFGGCGMIAGDTIYLLGGATFAKYYPPSRSFYKGLIDVTNPLHITWIKVGEYPGEYRYRSAAFIYQGRLYVVGGSNETYNYNGISYAEKKPVEPNTSVLIYDQRTGRFTTEPHRSSVMDLRGVVSDGNGNIYTVGGMTRGQHVSGELKKVWSPRR